MSDIAMYNTEPCPTCGKGREVVNPAYLRAIREEAGLSLREMGRRIGVTATYLCDVELGRRRCTSVIERAYRQEWTRLVHCKQGGER